MASTPDPSVANGGASTSVDAVMTDASSAPAVAARSASGTPARGTPNPQAAATVTSAMAAEQEQPGSSATGAAAASTPMPARAMPHGALTRQYLNENVTGVLLEGMKMLAMRRPDDPLRTLGQFLLDRSKELEAGVGDGRTGLGS